MPRRPPDAHDIALDGEYDPASGQYYDELGRFRLTSESIGSFSVPCDGEGVDWHTLNSLADSIPSLETEILILHALVKVQVDDLGVLEELPEEYEDKEWCEWFGFLNKDDIPRVQRLRRQIAEREKIIMECLGRIANGVDNI